MTENEAIHILGEKYTEIEYYFAEHDCYMKEYDAEFQKAINVAIKALKEIQKYQEIESEIGNHYHANVDIRTLMRYFIETIFKGERHEGFCILTNEEAKMWKEYQLIGKIDEIKRMQKYSSLAKKHDTIGKVIDSCSKYEEIGTVEEFQDAIEKQRAKKPILDTIYHWNYYCSNCQEFITNKNGDRPHHCICGQAIDWSDTN